MEELGLLPAETVLQANRDSLGASKPRLQPLRSYFHVAAVLNRMQEQEQLISSRLKLPAGSDWRKKRCAFDFQVENSSRTVQYKLNAQSLRLFGLHSDVNDAHRAGANRLQNKNKQQRAGFVRRVMRRQRCQVCRMQVITSWWCMRIRTTGEGLGKRKGGGVGNVGHVVLGLVQKVDRRAV